jgi:predicted branched-subunit amino acid permease
MTTIAPSVETTSRALDPRRDALRDLRTVAPGVIPFGMFLGVTITVTGTGALAGLLGAAAVYAGSAQLATISVLHLGSGLLAAVAAGVVVNARILLYGAALEPWFRSQPRWFRLLGVQFVLDQTYLSAVERPEYRDSAVFRRYWLWMGLSLLGVWLAAVGTGVALGPLAPDMPHLILVGTAMFVGMLVPRLVNRASCVAAAAAAVAALGASHVAPTAAILAGAAAGVLAAVLVSRRDAGEASS